MREKVDAARAFVEGFDAADPAIASAQAIADEWGSGVDSMSARPVGGYRPLFEFLTSACIAAGVQLSLSTVVSRISRQREGVVVEHTTAGGSAGTLNARARHRDAARRRVARARGRRRGRVRAAAAGRQTQSAACDRNGRCREGCAVVPHALLGAHPRRTLSRGRVLPSRSAAVRRLLDAVAYSQRDDRRVGGRPESGRTGRCIGGRVDRARASRIRRTAWRAGARTCRFEGAAFHNWARDPFARGAYSYVAVGGAGARLALAAPIDGTIFFAGEATSNDGQGGTVNGAFETGERAAREAATSLGVTLE